MTTMLKQIVSESKNLSAFERIQLVEEMYKSFEREEEAEITRMWAEESERRLDAFERGEIAAIDYEDVTKMIR